MMKKLHKPGIYRVCLLLIFIFVFFNLQAYGFTIKDKNNENEEIPITKLGGITSCENEPGNLFKGGSIFKNIEVYFVKLKKDTDEIFIDLSEEGEKYSKEHTEVELDDAIYYITNRFFQASLEDTSLKFSQEYPKPKDEKFTTFAITGDKCGTTPEKIFGTELPSIIDTDKPLIMVVALNFDSFLNTSPSESENELEKKVLETEGWKVILIEKAEQAEQAEQQEVDKTELKASIAEAEDIITNHSEKYYTEYDRYAGVGHMLLSNVDEHGKWLDFYKIEERAKKGYWLTFKEKYEKAKKVNDDKNALKTDVEAATTELKNSMKGFLPKTEVNATELMDALYYWAEDKDFKKAKDEATDVSLMEYEANVEKAKEILAGLYDEQGNPTDKNWGPARQGQPPQGAYTQDMIDELNLKITKSIWYQDGKIVPPWHEYAHDPSIDGAHYYPFFSKKKYEANKTEYFGMLPELLATLEKFAPDKINSGEYTKESFDEYVQAYNNLTKHLEIDTTKHPFVSNKKFDSGSLRDKTFFSELFKRKLGWKGVKGYLQSYEDAKYGLQSANDIDVELKYVSNYMVTDLRYLNRGIEGGFNMFRAREEKDTSTDIYENQVRLEKGKTNLYYALEKSGIRYDFKDGVYNGSSRSKVVPTCLVYVNGKYEGTKELTDSTSNETLQYKDELKNINLHAGDKIKLVRVYLSLYKGEASSGYDTTQISTDWLGIHSNAYPYVEQSIADIEAKKIDKPIKVGDKVDFSVDVHGSLETNKDKKFEKDGIVLFVSNPSTENKLSRIEKMTTATTGKDGKLQYIFTKPGYYTVAFFNMTHDELFFQDVYRNITPGKYYSMQAGDYQIIKVDPLSIEEEKAVFEKIKKEKLKEAEDYFKDVHDYDFMFPYTYAEVKNWYDNLVTVCSKAASLDEFMDSYEVLFNKMDERAHSDVYDHKAIIAKLRGLLEKLPADLADANYKHQQTILEIQKMDKSLNDYQRSLLSEVEQERIKEALAKLADGSLNNLPNYVPISEPASSLNFAKDPGWSTEAGNFNKVFKNGGSKMTFYSWSNKTHLDGEANSNEEVREPVFKRTTSEGVPQEAKMIPGDRLIMRRYLATDSEHFGLAYSINGGAWQPADRVELNPKDPSDPKKMFYIDYTMPDGFKETKFEISLKQMSEAEYGAMQLANEPGAKDAAKATLEAEYEKYDKMQYTNENWQKIEAAKAKGLKDIEEATSLDSVTVAKNTAIMAMSTVKTKKQEAEPNPSAGGISEVPLPDFGTEIGRVHVIVENQTFKGSDASWHGKLIDGWYDLEERDTMMTSILKALQLKGCHWSTGSQGVASSWDDYNISYLASVKLTDNTKGDGRDFVVNDRKKVLGEFSGERGSGWMGTLNDWFTNEGFNAFGVKNGKLEDGDEIHVMFTQNLGVDLGGTWGNSDTRVASLDIKGKGKLSPRFSPDVKEYMYILPAGGNDALTINPVAKNKNYLVKTFLNRYNSDSAYFKKTRTVPVKKGDVLYIGCGDKSWPSMNKQGTEARDYTGSMYTIRVVDGVQTFVQDAIKALPTVNRISLNNYTRYESTVKSIKDSYDAMSKEEKAKISADELSTFTAVYERVQFFAKIDAVKKILAKLPNEAKADDGSIRSAKSDIEKADSLYKALNDEQKKYITTSDAANYNKLVERLGKLKISTSAKSIAASEQAPVSTVIEPKAEVKGDKATAKLDARSVNQVIAEAAKQGEKKIVIEPQGTGDAKEITVSIPKASAQALADKKDMAVFVETKSGQVSIPAQAMASIVKEAKGTDVTLDIALKEKSAIKDLAAQKLMENKDAVAVEIKIESAGSAIDKFASPIEIMLPVNDKFKEGKLYPVTQISADGTKSNPIGKCVKIGGKLYIKLSTDHLSIFVASPEAVSDSTFLDIQGHWAYDAIKYATENKLMNGVSADKFAPNDTLSRAMLTTILYRIEGEPKIAYAQGSKDGNPIKIYGDVEQGKWYSDAVAWASKEGIVTGYSKDTFAPNDNITREQLAAMVQRYTKYKKLDVTKQKDLSIYKDARNISPWATDAMKWAGAEGLVNGRTSDSVVPGGTATRAEAATILKRYMENVLKSKPAETKADDKAKADSKTKAAS